MKLAADQILRLAQKIIRRLQEQSEIEAKAPEGDLVKRVESLIEDYVQLSRNVEGEVRKIMDQYANQMSGDIDTRRMYSMIRKQVAEKMKFELDAEEQVTHLSHQVHDRLYNDDLVDYPDEDRALKTIKKVFRETLQAEDELDDEIRKKIASLKRTVMEGSPEWEVLYRKYMDEALAKKGL